MSETFRLCAFRRNYKINTSREPIVSFVDLLSGSAFTKEELICFDTYRQVWLGEIMISADVASHVASMVKIDERRSFNGIPYVMCSNDILIPYSLHGRVCHASLVGLFNIAYRMNYEFGGGVTKLKALLENSNRYHQSLNPINGQIVAIFKALSSTLVTPAVNWIASDIPGKFDPSKKFYFQYTKDRGVKTVCCEAKSMACYLMNVILEDDCEWSGEAVKYNDLPQIDVLRILKPLVSEPFVIRYAPKMNQGVVALRENVKKIISTCIAEPEIITLHKEKLEIDNIKILPKAEFVQTSRQKSKVLFFNQYRQYLLSPTPDIIEIVETDFPRDKGGHCRGFVGDVSKEAEYCDTNYFLVPVVLDAYGRIVYGLKTRICSKYKKFDNSKGTVVSLVIKKCHDKRDADDVNSVHFFKVRRKVRFRIAFCFLNENSLVKVSYTSFIQTAYVLSGRKMTPKLMTLKEIKREKKRVFRYDKGLGVNLEYDESPYSQREIARWKMFRLRFVAIRFDREIQQLNVRGWVTMMTELFRGYTVL